MVQFTTLTYRELKFQLFLGSGPSGTSYIFKTVTVSIENAQNQYLEAMFLTFVLSVGPV